MLNSIKNKMMMIVGLIVVLSIVCLAVVNYKQSESIIINNVQGEITAKAVASTNELGLWVAGRRSEVGTIGSGPAIKDGTMETILPYLQSEVQRIKDENGNKLYQMFFVAQPSGDSYNTLAMGPSANISQRDYFKKALTLKAGETVVSDPLISAADNKTLVVVVATPIIKNNTVVGVLGGLISIEDFNKRVGAIKSGKTGYAVVTRGGWTDLCPSGPECDYETESSYRSNCR